VQLEQFDVSELGTVEITLVDYGGITLFYGIFDYAFSTSKMTVTLRL
jgi:hypothetical protein